jgi:hypothetical protein
LVGFHPLWPIALADLALADYEDAPWSIHFRITPATVDNSVLGVENNSEHEEILKARTQIFDSLSNMSQLQQSQRIVLVRNNFEPCLKLAGQSARQCKLACAYLIELQNRLKMVNMKSPSLCLKMSAVDSSLSRNANYLGINLANRNSSKSKKRKSYDETGGVKKRRGCRTCRDVFKESPSIYYGHRSGSSKCPNKSRKPNDLWKPTNLETIDESGELICPDLPIATVDKPPSTTPDQEPSIESSSDSCSDDSVVAKAREYLTQNFNDSDSSVDKTVFKSVSELMCYFLFYLYC